MPADKYFEEIEPGDELGPITLVPTTEKIRQFAKLQDPAGRPSRFTSDEVAKQQGLPFAMMPGIMGCAYLSKLLTTALPNARVKRLDTVFRQSIPHNKPIRLIATVTDKKVTNGENTVECDVYLQKEDGENMMTANALLFLPSKSS